MESANSRGTFWLLYLRWLWVHVLGVPLTFFLGLLLSLVMGPETGVMIMAAPAMAIGAMVFSYVQLRTLIKIDEINLIWIILSGLALAYLYHIAFAVWIYNNQAFSALIGGAVLGGVQFLILRKRVAGVFWWLPASVIAWSSAFYICNLAGIPINPLDEVYGIGLLGLIVGAITGIPYAMSFSVQKI